MIQVRIVLEGADKFSNLIGSLHYPNGDEAVDLSLELLKNVSFFNCTIIVLINLSFC